MAVDSHVLTTENIRQDARTNYHGIKTYLTETVFAVFPRCLPLMNLSWSKNIYD